MDMTHSGAITRRGLLRGGLTSAVAAGAMADSKSASSGSNELLPWGYSPKSYRENWANTAKAPLCWQPRKVTLWKDAAGSSRHIFWHI